MNIFTFLANLNPGGARVEELPVPRGIVLKDEKAEELIESWEDKQVVVEEDAQRFANVVPSLHARIKEVDIEAKTEARNLAGIKKHYSGIKTPLTKRRWARRLVLSQKTLDHLKESQQLMRLNVDRAEAAIEDAKAIGRLLDHKIKDARLYYELNGQIRLLGSALAFAENIESQTGHIEKDVEVSVEGLESIVSKFDDEDLVRQADAIVGKGA